MSILLRKLIRQIILEQIEEVTLKVPKEQAQKDELMTLMSLLSKKMPGSEESLESAKAEIAKGNWDEALELIKMYFIMKKLRLKNQNINLSRFNFWKIYFYSSNAYKDRLRRESQMSMVSQLE